MKGKANSNSHYPDITVWGLLKKHVLGKKLIIAFVCLIFTTCITFLRPLVVKGITDEGMLKANMRMIVLFAILLLLCSIIDQLISIGQACKDCKFTTER